MATEGSSGVSDISAVTSESEYDPKTKDNKKPKRPPKASKRPPLPKPKRLKAMAFEPEHDRAIDDLITTNDKKGLLMGKGGNSKDVNKQKQDVWKAVTVIMWIALEKVPF